MLNSYNEAGLTELAIAVVKQAADDYRRAKKGKSVNDFSVSGIYRVMQPEDELKNLRRFFLEDCGRFTDIPGRYILDELDKEPVRKRRKATERRREYGLWEQLTFGELGIL